MLGKKRRKVRMFIHEGPTIEGVLLGRTRHTYVIAAPSHVVDDPHEPKLEIAGHVEIPRERVLYFQVVG